MNEKRPYQAIVGARVKFVEDHECYAGMVGRVTEVITLDPLRLTFVVQLDEVGVFAEEIEPEDTGENRG